MSVEFVEKKRWLFLGLPFTFTKYVIKEDMITVDTGVYSLQRMTASGVQGTGCGAYGKYLGENGRTWHHCLLYR